MDPAEIEGRAVSLQGPLTPLLPAAPSSRQLPTLQLRSSTESPFGTQRRAWRCDTFIVPAAFPRALHSSRHPAEKKAAAGPASAGPPPKVDLQKALVEIYEAQIEASGKQVDVKDREALAAQEQLFISVNRYSLVNKTRVGKEPALTLVFAHANGFHKEIWEPTISELLSTLDDPSQPQATPVEEIWALDCVSQGDSAVLNEDALGNSFYWADNGRDILNLIISYIDSPLHPSPSPSSEPSLVTPTSVPSTFLSPVADPSTTSLQLLDTLPPSPGSPIPFSRIFRDRLIVGIGHSLGGAGMAFAATASPSLFSSIIFCDPVLPPSTTTRQTGRLVKGAVVRRETWKDREEAKEGFLKKPFFRAWDSRVLDKYIQYGLKDTASGEVALKARARDEALIFADPMTVGARRASSRLYDLTPSLPVHFLLADVGRSVLDEPSIEHMLTRVPHATHTRVEGAAHLIAQEKPRETAEGIAKVLRRLYPASGVARL